MKLWINKNNFNGRDVFSTTIQDKEKTAKTYLDIQFKKDNEPKQAGQIEIRDCFFSCYKSNEILKPKLVIMDYEFIKANEVKEKVKSDPFAEFGDTLNLDEDNFLD